MVYSTTINLVLLWIKECYLTSWINIWKNIWHGNTWGLLTWLDCFNDIFFISNTYWWNLSNRKISIIMTNSTCFKIKYTILCAEQVPFLSIPVLLKMLIRLSVVSFGSLVHSNSEIRASFPFICIWVWAEAVLPGIAWIFAPPIGLVTFFANSNLNITLLPYKLFSIETDQRPCSSELFGSATQKFKKMLQIKSCLRSIRLRLCHQGRTNLSLRRLNDW